MSIADDVRRALPDRIAERPVVAAVLAITVLALLLRVIALGDRIAHFDEARVAHWALRYAETGTYEYRPVTHGPFIHLVGGWVMSVFGASDLSIRLIVALFGGMLPLAALLFRRYLSGVEVVALATFLALDPVMLYYSRFFRNDVLVGGFAFVALGLFVLAYHRRRPLYLYAGTLSLALSFTAKENAIVYVLCWLGAGALLLDHVLFRPGSGESGLSRIGAAADRWQATLGSNREAIRRWTLHSVGAVVVFLAVLTFFYAPRGAAATVGPLEALVRPTTIPGVVHEALFERFLSGYDHWDGDSGDGLGYRELFWRLFEPTLYGSGIVLLLGVAGFVYERYVVDRPRLFVLAASYWGFASIVGYPLAGSVEHPAWIVVHVVLPLSIPAAVTVGVIYRWGVDAYHDNDEVGVALCVLILLVAVGGMLAIAYDTSYANPQSSDNIMVQFAQPEGEFQDELAAMERAAEENDGVDVLYYGEEYHIEDESVADRAPAGPGEWYHRLPLPWYDAAAGAEVSSEEDIDGLEAALEDEPPIVIADAHDPFGEEEQLPSEEVLERIGGGYQYAEYDLRAPGRTVTIFVHEEYVEE